MRFVMGRVLQVIGLALVLIGLFVGVSVSNVKAELIYLAVGVVVFYGGRWLERAEG